MLQVVVGAVGDLVFCVAAARQGSVGRVGSVLVNVSRRLLRTIRNGLDHVREGGGGEEDRQRHDEHDDTARLHGFAALFSRCVFCAAGKL